MGVDVIRIALKQEISPLGELVGPPTPTVSVYPKTKTHALDGEVWSQSRWLTVRALHDAFPWHGSATPEIARVEALIQEHTMLGKKIDAIIRQMGGAS